MQTCFIPVNVCRFAHYTYPLDSVLRLPLNFGMRVPFISKFQTTFTSSNCRIVLPVQHSSLCVTHHIRSKYLFGQSFSFQSFWSLVFFSICLYQLWFYELLHQSSPHSLKLFLSPQLFSMFFIHDSSILFVAPQTWHLNGTLLLHTSQATLPI